MVYHRPITDGHVLICPRRKGVERLSDLTELETLEAYDSMTHLTLLGIFEDEFGKKIESEDLIALKTIGELLELAGLE